MSGLGGLAGRFSGFEQQVEAEAKARREVEESNYEAARGNIARLGDSLNAEIRNRADGQRGLQEVFEVEAKSAQESLESVFLERFDQIHSMVNGVTERMLAIEKDFGQSQTRYVCEMRAKTSTVDRNISIFKTNLESSLAERRERETLLHSKVDNLQQGTLGKFEQLAEICDQKFGQLVEEFKETSSASQKGTAGYQDAAKAEVVSSRKALAAQSTAREQADDDIVTALNQYTKALQDAMCKVSQETLRAASRS